MVPIQRISDFLKAWKELFQIVCSNPKFEMGHNFLLFFGGKTMGYSPWYFVENRPKIDFRF